MPASTIPGVRVLAPPPPLDLEPGPQPRFSVLIPAYQAAATIGAAVESALAQVPAPHEVIVVDDGSTDDTAGAVQRFGDRVVLLQRPNRGPAAARNAGVAVASGDFVVLLDADDAYEPGRLRALSDLAVARPDLDIVCTDALLDVDGEVVGTIFEHTGFPVEDQSAEILARNFVVVPAVKRDRLLAVGGFDEALRRGEDWDCWIRLLHAGARAGAVAEPLLRYRIGGPSLSADRVSDLRARLEVLGRAGRMDLSGAERAVLVPSMSKVRRATLLAEAEQGLREHRRDARRRALRVALGAGMGVATRGRALAAALAPRLAARRLELIEEATGHSYMRRSRPGRSS